MPFSMSIEPTTHCNLKCSECISGQRKFTRKEGSLDLDNFKEVINQSYKYLLNCFLYFQGEPFINKNIIEFIKYANSKNVFTATSSNGHFFDFETARDIAFSGLDKLIISLDGTTQQTYEKYRINGDFKKVISGIENIVKVKKKYNLKKPFIVLQFLVLGTNEHQIKEIEKLAKQLEVNKLELKSVQIYNYENGKIFLPKNKKYLRYIDDGVRIKMKSKLRNKCWRLWNSSVITWDGIVLPCCYDKDAKYQFGNVFEQNLNKIIKNNKAKEFRKAILNNRKSIDICNNCTTE